MRTKTHVTAVTAAFLTLRQRLVQRLEKKCSRKPVAALLAGILMAVLAPTAALAQHAVGSLYFLDRATGSEAYGYFDRYGFFRQTFSGGITSVAAPWVGATHVVNSTNGLLIYDADNGTASVEQIKDNGLPNRGGSFNLSVGWNDIVSIKDYLFFYKDDGSAAIGYIAASDRKFVGTASYLPGSFSYWSHIVATDNNLFFYNRTNGSALVGYIHPFSGAFMQTQSLPPGSLPTDFDYIVSDGNFLLLYNQQTGGALVGVIDYRPGQFLSRWNGSLPPGYNKLVRHDRYLLLYNSITGGGTIGYIDRISAAKFIVTEQPAFSAGWIRIVSTNDDLLFYNWAGSAAVGRIDHNGQFQQTPQALSFSPGWFGVVATAR